MHPVIARFGPVAILTHDAFVTLGIGVAALVLLWEVRRRKAQDERLWYVLAGALAGGALFARLGTWAQHLDPRDNATLIEQWAYGNRSILSGLVGAYAGALVAKRVARYPYKTGDLFAPAVAIGMAVGRLGCFFAEPPGTPTSLPWGVTLDAGQAAAMHVPAGVPLHPSFAYEILFHAAAFVALLALRKRVTTPGRLFTLYLAAYATFRFGVEFVRGNEVVYAGLTRAQMFLLACVPLAAARHAWRARTDRAETVTT
ncbi:prolipoprotein diacylglyceryl transferase [Dactylosporangium roseum]|uniref:Prolipoprotein diacylglyceryl transferase n=1 Tax=Dactylosporangium roseum TaxID=47989 RepID=A0ABY5Z7S9_9ACTN|nr:prolipoprotein diacylglyceryl transferase [Dactylosporangium roseum]UWZ38135.1 prolipoprotein diacylglyceryl transferase [Dactylosporangium roseum]